MIIVIEGSALHLLTEQIERLQVHKFSDWKELEDYLSSKYKILRVIEDSRKRLYIVSDGFIELEVFGVEVE